MIKLRTVWQHSLFICLLMTAVPDVTAQRLEPWTTSRLKGTAEKPAAFRIREAFSGQTFDHPTSLIDCRGSNELLVTQMNGLIFTLQTPPDTAARHQVADLSQLAGGPVNLFSAALHPDFPTNRELYVCMVHPEGGRHTRVSRFETQSDAAGRLTIREQSEQVILRWPSGGHNGGCLRFGPDGLLYISTGDGSGPNPPDGLTTGQNISDLLGSILRIDVNHVSSDRAFAIPADNPFINVAGARPEIFAYGLRNPWKFGIDPESADVFVADNGWETWEMIHHVRNGQNCGWPIMEGRAQLRTEVPAGPTRIIPPVRDHHHSEANSVIGGPVYREQKLSELNGYFIYGDYITGTIWGVKAERDQYAFRDVLDTDLRIVDFTQGSRGELFILDYDFTGGIYELLPNDVEDLSEQFPRRLSETGLFASLTELNAAPGVAEYRVVVPRWQDGAASRRWVAIPGTAAIRQSGSAKDTAYPDGTVFVKHLAIPTSPPTPLETQILHFDNGSWNPYSYLWNDDGSDAELVPSIGANKSVHWPDNDELSSSSVRTWRANATNECRMCHDAAAGFVLGFNPQQLRRPIESGPEHLTHYEAMHKAGIIESQGLPAHDYTLVNPQDPKLDLNDRARSYLHANCSMCHHKRGNAIVGFFLRRELPFDQLNTNRGTGIGTFGMQNARIIAPGDPYRSVLMYRMSKLGYSHMPYIGSQVVDSHGVTLIAEWIRSLSPDRTAETSSPLVPGSPEASALGILQTSDQPSHRSAAITRLAASTEGSLALIEELHAGRLTPTDLESALAASRSQASDIRGLFDDFVPEAERRKTLGRVFDPQVLLSKQGDVARGKLIFFSDNARCRTCHDIDDPVKSTGPTLTDISKKYIRPSELLQHILKPSDKIDDKYAAWIVVKSSGQVLTGLRQAENASSISLRTVDGTTVTVQKDEIEEQQQSRKSLMPEGILSDLTIQEAADLLAFIHGLSPHVAP